MPVDASLFFFSDFLSLTTPQHSLLP